MERLIDDLTRLHTDLEKGSDGGTFDIAGLVKEAIDTIKRLNDFDNSQSIKLLQKVGQLEAELSSLIKFTAKLVHLCNPTKEWESFLFRRFSPGVGDYMGSGYLFVDGFHRIWEEFDSNADDKLYHAIINEVNRLQEAEKALEREGTE